MSAPRLRMRVAPDGMTYCGRPGCEGYIGAVMLVDGDRRVHLLEPWWTHRNGAWELTRKRHRVKRWSGSSLPDALQAVEPDDVVRCGKCSAVQALPEGAAVGLHAPIRHERGVRVETGRVSPLPRAPSV